MCKKATIVMVLMALALGVSAQRVGEADSSRWDFHLSTGTSVMSSGKKADTYLWVSPSVGYRASDRLTLHGGFSAVGSLLGGYELRGDSRNLAPLRRGTRLMKLEAGVDYKVSDRLSLWATVMHLGGWHEPVWSPLGEAFRVGVTAVSGGFSYALSDESLLEMHFHFVHDLYGNDALGILAHPYYGYGVPCYEIFGGPWPY